MITVIQRAAVRSRSLHSSAVIRSGHGPYEVLHPNAPIISLFIATQHLPFKSGEKEAGPFAVKLVAYLGLGFSIPFIASFYQMCVHQHCILSHYSDLLLEVNPSRGPHKNRL